MGKWRGASGGSGAAKESKSGAGGLGGFGYRNVSLLPSCPHLHSDCAIRLIASVSVNVCVSLRKGQQCSIAKFTFFVFCSTLLSIDHCSAAFP